MLSVIHTHTHAHTHGLPWWLSGKESTCNAGDLVLIPGSGRSPGGGKGYPLQYYYLENRMDRGAWWSAVHGVAESQTWMSNWTALTHTWFLKFIFLAMLHSMWNTSSLTKDSTHVPLQWKRWVLTTGQSEKSYNPLATSSKRAAEAFELSF